MTDAERTAAWNAWRATRTTYVTGTVTIEMPWHNYFTNLIPEGIDGIYVVVRNTCHQEMTFLVNGPDVIYLGSGSLHEHE